MFHAINGNKYYGEFLNNSKSGVGAHFFASGNKYLGDFLNDEWNGKG